MKTLRDEIGRELGELAGSASLCWNLKPEGVFDSTLAITFVDSALEAILTAISERLPKESDFNELTDSMSLMERAIAIGKNECLTEVKKRLGVE